MPTLILLRHGQSVWNLENRFTGNVDVALSPLGQAESKQAGELLKYYPIDIIFTSVLERAIDTVKIVLQQLAKNIPIIKSEALNERSYGELQGLNKTETEQKYGVEQVLQWRRSYDSAPPKGESLKDTYKRVILYYKQTIELYLKADKNVLIVAHGNSLRALMMFLEGIDKAEIEEINITTGIPKIYQFNQELKLQKTFYI